MSEIKELTDELVKFRDARNWQQFHNSKDLTTGPCNVHMVVDKTRYGNKSLSFNNLNTGHYISSYLRLNSQDNTTTGKNVFSADIFWRIDLNLL